MRLKRLQVPYAQVQQDGAEIDLNGAVLLPAVSPYAEPWLLAGPPPVGPPPPPAPTPPCCTSDCSCSLPSQSSLPSFLLSFAHALLKSAVISRIHLSLGVSSHLPIALLPMRPQHGPVQSVLLRSSKVYRSRRREVYCALLCIGLWDVACLHKPIAAALPACPVN